jgi:hypothetical protein
MSIFVVSLSLPKQRIPCWGQGEKGGAEWREVLISSGVFSMRRLWIAMRPQQQQDLSSWRDVVLQAPLDILVCFQQTKMFFLLFPQKLSIPPTPQQQQNLSSWRDVVLQAPLDVLVCFQLAVIFFPAPPPEVVKATDTTTTAKVEIVARCGAAGPPCNSGVFSTIGDISRAPPPKLVNRP